MVGRRVRGRQADPLECRHSSSPNSRPDHDSAAHCWCCRRPGHSARFALVAGRLLPVGIVRSDVRDGLVPSQQPGVWRQRVGHHPRPVQLHGRFDGRERHCRTRRSPRAQGPSGLRRGGAHRRRLGCGPDPRASEPHPGRRRDHQSDARSGLADQRRPLRDGVRNPAGPVHRHGRDAPSTGRRAGARDDPLRIRARTRLRPEYPGGGRRRCRRRSVADRRPWRIGKRLVRRASQPGCGCSRAGAT